MSQACGAYEKLVCKEKTASTGNLTLGKINQMLTNWFGEHRNLHLK